MKFFNGNENEVLNSSMKAAIWPLPPKEEKEKRERMHEKRGRAYTT